MIFGFSVLKTSHHNIQECRVGLGTICWHNFEHNNFMLGCGATVEVLLPEDHIVSHCHSYLSSTVFVVHCMAPFHNYQVLISAW